MEGKKRYVKALLSWPSLMNPERRKYCPQERPWRRLSWSLLISAGRLRGCPSSAKVQCRYCLHWPVGLATIPVFVGDLVTLKASLILCRKKRQWNLVSGVEAENLITGHIRHTASAYLTFVALDSNGRPLAFISPGSGNRWRKAAKSGG